MTAQLLSLQPRATRPWRHDILITLAALALLLLWDASGLDLAVQRAWGDASGFTWRDHWLTRDLLHDGGRWLAGAVLLALVVNIWRPMLTGPSRAERVRWLVVSVASLLLVPMLKQASHTSCPWDLAEFGGAAQYVSHWRLGLADGGAGHCFPSGHATAALAFFSGWFALRRDQACAARLWLAAVIALGTLYGWAQMARGAHFVSHTLWSAWLCWTLAMLTTPRRG